VFLGHVTAQLLIDLVGAGERQLFQKNKAAK
jgi:hypothetical protein